MLLALHNVLAGFLRRTWLVALATVFVCAGFAARALAALDDGAAAVGVLAPPGPGGPGAASKAAPAPAAARTIAPAPTPERVAASGAAFVERNIFCSTCPPPTGGPGASSAYQGHPAVLIATSMGAEPRATVRVVPTEVQGSWGIGEDIPGVGRVEEIHATSIEVADAAGHTKLLSLIEAGTGGGDPRPPDENPPGVKNPYEGRLSKIDETTYEVERALVRELVMNASKPGMGGATPVVVNGEVKGIRLIGIGPASPGHALGLRSRDMITEIDGVPLRNAQQVIDLFAKLEQVSSVELAGTRGSQPLKRTLKLR